MSVHCVTVTALVHAHGVCALESSSYNIRRVLRKGLFHALPCISFYNAYIPGAIYMYTM